VNCSVSSESNCKILFALNYIISLLSVMNLCYHAEGTQAAFLLLFYPQAKLINVSHSGNFLTP
jgi:hypothetical protein